MADTTYVVRGDELLKQWLTPKDIARTLNVHRNTVSRWVSSGRLAAIRTPSGRVLINADELQKIISSPAEPVAA